MISQKAQEMIGQFITICLINLVVVLVLGAVLFSWLGVASGADGSLQKDPIFQNSKGVSRDNLILRDPDGRWIEYWQRDPILENNWIRFKKDRKVGVVVDDPILRDRAIIFDDVGE